MKHKQDGEESKLQELETMAQGFNTAKDFDKVMAHFDVKEISENLHGKELLEVGTSAGTVTKYLLPFATQLDIIEGSRIGIERSKEALGDGNGKITYHHTLWEEYEPERKYSDIILIRALEHVDEPVQLLNQMKGWLAPEGRLHVIVPNAQSLHRRIMVHEGTLPDIYAFQERDRQVGHKRIYDRQSLHQDMTAAGFSVDTCRGFFVKPLTTPGMAKITMNPKHPFVTACYAAGKILPALGTQLYAVGEKNE